MDGGVSAGAFAFDARPVSPRVSLATPLPASRTLGSIAEVAAVVSSGKAVEQVLRRIVDEAKWTVPNGKAVLQLFDAVPGSGVELVRGERTRHPETWWRHRLDELRPIVVEEGAPRVANDPATGAEVAVVPVRTHDRTIGLLAAIQGSGTGFSAEQLTELAILGAFTGAAIENSRLRRQSEDALLAGERNRIAKEMHDGLAQSLFSVSLSLEICKRLMRTSPGQVEGRLAETQQLLGENLTELRRYIYDLRPTRLEQLGLTGAIHSRIAEVTRAGSVAGRFETEGEERRLAPAAEACVYRVCQEALANVVKHSRARHVIVRLVFGAADVELLVEDDGCGFDSLSAISSADGGRSLGLSSIRDRVTGAGGELTIRSVPGQGASIHARVPC